MSGWMIPGQPQQQAPQYQRQPFQQPFQRQPGLQMPRQQTVLSSSFPTALPPNALSGHFGFTPLNHLLNAQPKQDKTHDKALQKQYPGNYARLASWTPIHDAANNVRQTWDAWQRIQTNTPIKDQQLVTLNDNVKMTGSLLIATLATLGLKQKVFGIREYLGFLSWFGAMAATPRIINNMVLWKTGVNLNQVYDSTYGQKQNLFKDPHYLPLHILPDAVINRTADKLGIPPGPHRRQLTEEKMRQISVQTHTWWMLVAGPATPVVSGLICDLLENPALRGVNQIKKAWTALRANQALNLENTNPDVLAGKTKAYLEQLLGELPESQLSGWWKSFGTDMVHKTGLARAFSVKELLKGDRDSLVDKLISHFEKHQPGDNVMAYLDRQYKPAHGADAASGYLETIRAKAQAFLEKAKDKLKAEAFEEQQRLIDRRILNTENTVNHYRSLFETIREAMQGKRKLDAKDKDWIRMLIRDSNITTLQERIPFKTAAKLAGEQGVFDQISGCLQDGMRQFKHASDIMGASPEKHLLDDALKNVMLRSQWRRRMGLYLGGGLLAATAIYSYFFVGRNFNAQSQSGGGASS